MHSNWGGSGSKDYLKDSVGLNKMFGVCLENLKLHLHAIVLHSDSVAIQVFQCTVCTC